MTAGPESFGAATHPITVRDFRPFTARFDFDPTYGHTLQQLLGLQVQENAPNDFRAFWQKTHDAAETVPLNPEFRSCRFESRTHRVRELYFDSLEGYRVGGWLCEPTQATQLQRVEIFGHGYGGRECPDLSGLKQDVVTYFLCAPGFHLSAAPHRVVTNCGHLHVLTGIHSRETYILKACAAAFWGAARLMESEFPTLPIVYRGGSFGGGLGTLMLPWEPRFVAAEIVQPTFGYHSFRLAHRCHGSGESVRRITELVPQLRQTLAYYDAVFAAREVRIPVVVGVCAFDPSVPPPGQFGVGNAFPEQTRRLSFFSFGHCQFEVPGLEVENQRHAKAVEELLLNARRRA